MRFVIVTGMSGAGKDTALRFLEDMDYFCVGNLPIPLIKPFAEISVDGQKSLQEAHTIAETVHRSIEQTFPKVKHIMVHVNPVE